MISFNSMTDFLMMGGYGVYVWSAYSIVAIVLIVQAFRAKKH